MNQLGPLDRPVYDMAMLDRRFALAEGKLVYCVGCGMVMPKVWPLMAAHGCAVSPAVTS